MLVLCSKFVNAILYDAGFLGRQPANVKRSRLKRDESPTLRTHNQQSGSWQLPINFWGARPIINFNLRELFIIDPAFAKAPAGKHSLSTLRCLRLLFRYFFFLKKPPHYPEHAVIEFFIE
jgi:hypothetical protein